MVGNRPHPSSSSSSCPPYSFLHVGVVSLSPANFPHSVVGGRGAESPCLSPSRIEARNRKDGTITQNASAADIHRYSDGLAEAAADINPFTSSFSSEMSANVHTYYIRPCHQSRRNPCPRQKVHHFRLRYNFRTFYSGNRRPASYQYLVELDLSIPQVCWLPLKSDF